MVKQDKKEKVLKPMRVDEINILTRRARLLPPSGDQTYVLREGPDPWVIFHKGYYYFCVVDDLDTKRKILVSKFKDLKQLATAPLVEVWPRDEKNIPDYIEVWAPELQIIDGKPYIYVALYMGTNKTNTNRKERIHCLEGLTDNPQGEYKYKNQIQIQTDRWAIDGSVLEMPITKERYFVWSGWDGEIDHSQNIYIAKMSNPRTITSDRVCISTPEYKWEKIGYPYINEGPQPLIRKNKVFIIYSASGSWTDDYCLGQLTYVGGDPLSPSAWHKEPKPVFSKTDTIFGPGHCCFVHDNLGKDWIIYHAARSSGAGWARQIRAKQFTWHKNGFPNFGLPM
ncbi:MAG TPA: glycoside hydrolase family 43 protein [Candidatus Nitrosocosmicus sp.]|nr:glycoside hydrolase family 43 protein [Candidatus Nitrosocosmicus sp.]